MAVGLLEFLDWHSVPLGSGLQRMVLRISGRAFLGPEVCGDTRWIDATMGYLEMGVRTAFALQVVPRFLFPLQRWFPLCRKVCKHIGMTGEVLRPVIHSRREDGKSAQDAIGWFDEAAAGKPYDPVNSQLSLAFAATHTTADTITKVILHLAENPDVVLDLREEIIEAITRNDGLTKSALSQMNLLDSILKESQRLEPLASGIAGVICFLLNYVFCPLADEYFLYMCSNNEPGNQGERDPFGRPADPAEYVCLGVGASNERPYSIPRPR